MNTFTKGNVHDLQANPAWKSLLDRAKAMMDVADAKVETPGEFNQGYFVAMRKAYEALKAMPETMLAELEGHTGTQRMR